MGSLDLAFWLAGSCCWYPGDNHWSGAPQILGCSTWGCRIWKPKCWRTARLRNRRRQRRSFELSTSSLFWEFWGWTLGYLWRLAIGSSLEFRSRAAIKLQKKVDGLILVVCPFMKMSSPEATSAQWNSGCQWMSWCQPSTIFHVSFGRRMRTIPSSAPAASGTSVTISKTERRLWRSTDGCSGVHRNRTAKNWKYVVWMSLVDTFSTDPSNTSLYLLE